MKLLGTHVTDTDPKKFRSKKFAKLQTPFFTTATMTNLCK